jgi:D-cysteine desulfhydrase family pyridoxal phosphate-dependent enzyme
MIPRIRFAHLPTPIEPLPRIEKILGGPKLFIKRDDQTGLAFGGNKTRKLEFLVADAQAKDSDMLITTGALQSNHCRQTAAAAAKFGLGCSLVLVGEPPERVSANLFLDELFDAKIFWTDLAHRDSTLQDAFEKASAQGHKPYLVPYGGSNPTGALGYTFAMQEFLEQSLDVNWIVFASSSGGTQSGLVFGAHLFGFHGKLLGISVDEKQWVLKKRVAQLATETSALFGSPIEFKPNEILVKDDYAEPGYGIMTDIEREAIQLFAKYEGILLDPVYTGRAAAGMIDLIKKGFFKRDETILFWNTGGQPALFAEQYQGELFQQYTR